MINNSDKLLTIVALRLFANPDIPRATHAHIKNALDQIADEQNNEKLPSQSFKVRRMMLQDKELQALMMKGFS